MVPQAPAPHPGPETVQMTPMLVEPVTAALNWTTSFGSAEYLDGDTLTATELAALTRLMDALATTLFAVEVAITRTEAGEGNVDGAVYIPVADSVPHTETGLHPGPASVHVTAVLELPNTFAVNCWLEFSVTTAD